MNDLEKRIVDLENTIAGMTAFNIQMCMFVEEQEQVNEKLMQEIATQITSQLKDNVDRVYGRDETLATNFTGLMERYENRFKELEERFNEMTDLVEDILT